MPAPGPSTVGNGDSHPVQQDQTCCERDHRQDEHAAVHGHVRHVVVWARGGGALMRALGHQHRVLIDGPGLRIWTGLDDEYTRMHGSDAEQQHQEPEDPDPPGYAARRTLFDHATSITGKMRLPGRGITGAPDGLPAH